MANSCEDGIEANSDVSGIGIRASIYALCLSGRLLSFLVKLWGRDPRGAADFERAASAALSIQGLALLCTAIVQTAQRKLTLFHAIVVLHLLALLGINLASRGRYRGNELARAVADAAVVALAVVAFVAFNVYVWINAPGFGSQPECNASTVYVIFGVSVRATADVFRYIILATFAVVPAFFVVVLLLGMPCWVFAWCAIGRKADRNGAGGGGRVRRWLRRLFAGDGDGNDSSSSRSSVTSTRNSDALITEGLQTVAYAAFSIYCIISLEQMIARNPVSIQERDWGFGQIIALFLLGGTAYEFLGVCISSVGRKRARRDSSIGLAARNQTP